MEIITALALIFFGFTLGEFYTNFKLHRLMRKMFKEQGIDLDEEIKKRKETLEVDVEIHKLIVEQHGDMLYLYDTESNDFLCQGKSLEELADLSKKYKNVKHATVLHNDKVFMFINGLSKEYSQ